MLLQEGMTLETQEVTAEESHLVANPDEQGDSASSLVGCNLGLGLVLNGRPIHSHILHSALPASARHAA